MEIRNLKKIRILIIEDNRVLRDGITSMLNAVADMRVVASIGSGNNLIEKADSTNPQIILMDCGLQSFKESSLIHLIRRRMPKAKIVCTEFLPSQSNIIEFIEAGVSGFIVKDATTIEFIATIRSIALGEAVIPSSMTGSVFTHIAELALNTQKGPLTVAMQMTKREHEIMTQINLGMSNKDIASHLNIAIHTVKRHVRNIMEKLDLHSRLQLAKLENDRQIYTR